MRDDVPVRPPHSGFLVAALTMVAIFIALLAVSHIAPLPGQAVQVPLHSAMEAVGVLAAFLLAYLTIQMPGKDGRAAARLTWPACGLTAIGTLDLFHAAVPPGDLFVWLHSMSLLVGGLLFALVWLPQARITRRRYALPLLTTGATTIFSVLSIAMPAAVPNMVDGTDFTAAAKAINLAGGTLFLVAGVRLMVVYWQESGGEDLIAATLALLFALSGFLFSYSEVWGANWWLWHMVRLAAYLIAAAYVLNVFRNVSLMLAESNTALRQKSEELKHMNAELEEFIYIASHDLKAPLRAAANLALMVYEDTEDLLDDENRQRMRLLRERVQGMDALIEALLGYARLGGTMRENGPVPLGPFLNGLVDELPLPPGFGVELAEPLPTLLADPLQLKQIFQNLIINAADHHDRENGHVWIRAHDNGDAWSIDVADDGPGIPPAERGRVFRMFSTDGKAGHTGIGLAVVRKLVLANGGDIIIADHAPRGTVFRITWPKTEKRVDRSIPVRP